MVCLHALRLGRSINCFYFRHRDLHAVGELVLGDAAERFVFAGVSVFDLGSCADAYMAMAEELRAVTVGGDAGGERVGG